MRLPVILAFCDLCVLEGRGHVPADYSGPLVLLDVEADVDLCDSCKSALLGPARNLLDQLGHRAVASSPRKTSARPNRRNASRDARTAICGEA